MATFQIFLILSAIFLFGIDVVLASTVMVRENDSLLQSCKYQPMPGKLISTSDIHPQPKCHRAPHHQCTCNTSMNKWANPSQFNTEHADWRAIALSAATGVLASSLVIEGIGLLLLWKSGSTVHAATGTGPGPGTLSKIPSSPDFQSRPMSRNSSFTDSWAEPRSREWPERSDSDMQSNGRGWPGLFDESTF